jgi:hypothetical protein
VISFGSGLKLVLNEEDVMVEWIPDSDNGREGRRWLAIVSRGGRPRVEQSGATIYARRGMEWGSAPAPSHTGIRPQPRWVGGDWQRWWGSGRDRESGHQSDRRSGGCVQDRVPRFPGESGFGMLSSGPRPI